MAEIRYPSREWYRLVRKLIRDPTFETGLDIPQRELKQLSQWEKSFRDEASVDNYTLFRNHMKRLDLPNKPKLMVEGTISAMYAIWYYTVIDGKPSLRKFLNMQRCDPSQTPDARYVFTFGLKSNTYARILTDSELILPNMADLYDHPFAKLKTIGYFVVYISHLDWSPLTKKEIKILKDKVTADLRYDYPEEDDLHFFFDTGSYDTYLILGFYEVDEDGE